MFLMLSCSGYKARDAKPWGLGGWAHVDVKQREGSKLTGFLKAFAPVEAGPATAAGNSG